MELLILGNGFDLKCGLPTSYSAFFEDRFAKMPILQEIERHLYPANYNCFSNGRMRRDIDKPFNLLLPEINELIKDLTVWDVIFLSYKQLGYEFYNWTDVEMNIADFLVEGEEENFISYEEVLNFLNNEKKVKKYIRNKNVSDLPMSEAIRYEPQTYYLNQRNRADAHNKNSTGFFAEILPSFLVMQMARYVAHDCRELTTVDENYFLFELMKFEKSFAKYVKSSYDSNHAYFRKAKHLLNSLGFNPRQDKILNFNYTQALRIDQHNRDRENAREVNIHGNLENSGETIFGIDHRQIDPYDPAYGFTKTSRKLNANVTHRIKFSKMDSSILNKEKCTGIKIYGHSLGAADDSYFHSIFDYFNIYNSDTVFHYFYSDYAGCNPEENKREKTSAVIRLFDEYGQTMDNLSHGKNLVHKLMLEERIQIIKI